MHKTAQSKIMASQTFVRRSGTVESVFATNVTKTVSAFCIFLDLFEDFVTKVGRVTPQDRNVTTVLENCHISETSKVDNELA